jgi:protein-disulfide reductase (glutathione)
VTARQSMARQKRSRAWRLLPAFAAVAWLTHALACAPPSARDASAEDEATDWNAALITWRDYDAGLAEARARRKPIVLIFYTDWCPHCHNYSRVFYDPELVTLSRAFVMIRIERDGNPELSARYAPDGEYIPRTFFLTADGELQPELAGDNPDYRYFLGEHEPSELMALMQRALSG